MMNGDESVLVSAHVMRIWSSPKNLMHKLIFPVMKPIQYIDDPMFQYFDSACQLIEDS